MEAEDAFARAWAFECAMQDRCAVERTSFEFGVALANAELPRVYDANFVRFERRLWELTADVVEEACDALQSSLAHRKAVLPDVPVVASTVDALRERGWSLGVLVTMAYGGEAVDDRSRARAEEVEPVALRGVRRRAQEAMEQDTDAVRQIAAFTERMASVVPTRLFAAPPRGVEDEFGSFCALYQGDGIGQIEEVTTVLRHRRQGLGTAVTLAAVAASVGAGDSLTFLVADEADWPREWYSRLGFSVIGQRFELMRS